MLLSPSLPIDTMANVTFSTISDPLMTPALGICRFTPGMMQRDWVMVRLPRGLGEIAKDMGLSGADHVLELTYLNVPEGDVAVIFRRLERMWIPVSGNPRSGTLTVAGYGSYPHCVVVSCVPDAQAVRARSISTENPTGQKVFDLGFTVTFRQLRL